MRCFGLTPGLTLKPLPLILHSQRYDVYSFPMSDLLSALLLGILEGLTEFLPVSSTGHLLIAEHWLGHRSDFFNIVIQAGAILAVMLVFRARLWSLLTGLHDRENRDYLLKLIVAFGVTAVVGLPIRLAGWALPESLGPIAWALILGGIWMLLAESLAGRWRRPQSQITWSIAIAVGLAQVIAGIFPGTSRSGSAIFLALLLGLQQRAIAAEFVFLVGIPTMLAASGYACLEQIKHHSSFAESSVQIIVAFFAALVSGFTVVRWLLGYIKQRPFTPFAIYRIVLGLALLLWLPTG